MKNPFRTNAHICSILIALGYLLSFNAGCKDNANTPVTKAADSVATKPAPLVSAAATHSGAPADAAAILAKQEVPILCYHQIRDWKATDSKTARAYIVPPDAFRAQMQQLADSGYHTILPDQLMEYLQYNTSLPSKPVMITFDDTRLDQFTTALPELDKHQFKGVFFIMTVSLGRPGYMTREEVKQLSDQGHGIGSHTWDHHDVRKYEGNDWTTQIEKPSRLLQEITGKHMDYFAYPFGLWRKEIIPNLKQYNFKAAFQLSDKMDPNDPLYTVRRIIVPGSWSGATLLNRMHGAFPAK